MITKNFYRLTIVMALTVTSLSANAATYNFTVLGTLGGSTSQANGINASGQVVGSSSNANSTHAVLWDNGTITDLGTLGGDFSFAYGINASGQVVGVANTSGSSERAALWSNGTILGFGTLGGPYSYATAINDSGQVVGRANTGQVVSTNAVLWSNGTITNLGPLGRESRANSINASRQVVGSYDNSFGMVRAALWDNGTITDLGTLGGAGSVAYAINNSGQIVGESYTTGSSLTHHLQVMTSWLNK